MTRLLLVPVALVLTFWLAGCATLSKSQCEAGDWRGIGASDGYHGYVSSRFDQHVKACAEHGITPNRQLYDAGYAEGLTRYCTLDRAADEGTSGDVYRHVCSGETGLSFERVYEQARDVYEARQAAGDIRDEISDVNGQLGDPSLSADARRVLVRQINDLYDDLSDQSIIITREERRLRRVLTEETRRLGALGITG